MGQKKEIQKAKIELMLKMLKIFKKTYPDATCSLFYKNPFELAVATILSAQCTDERVNQVTPSLFKKYPTVFAMAKAELLDVEHLIRSTGFYRNKAKSLVEFSKAVVEIHKGELPQDLDALIHLRGIGRKTANVILGNAFGIPGLVVDTHVGRLSRRMGFTKQKDPVKVEYEMMEIVPRKDWTIYSHLLISHGRARCMARSPDCENCEVQELCPKIGVA